MHHGAAGEIEVFSEESAAPHHVGQGGVDQQQPERREQAPEAEAQALHQCAGDQRRRDDGEHALEQGKGHPWNRQAIPVAGEVVQHRVMEGISDHSVHAAPIGKGEAEADADPHQRGDAHHHQAHAHGVQDVAPLNKAAVEEGQAWRHQEHQGGTDQNQAVVSGFTATSSMGRQHAAE